MSYEIQTFCFPIKQQSLSGIRVIRNPEINIQHDCLVSQNLSRVSTE